jgi:hypothetical protein
MVIPAPRANSGKKRKEKLASQMASALLLTSTDMRSRYRQKCPGAEVAARRNLGIFSALVGKQVNLPKGITDAKKE